MTRRQLTVTADVDDPVWDATLADVADLIADAVPRPAGLDDIGAGDWQTGDPHTVTVVEYDGNELTLTLWAEGDET